ncbi:FecR family protein [Sphingobacterium hotanense]|uniref:FecR family protein n=1 Tax=Sphingobacterium hotanense TaxID=649196 RepID=A0ABT7NK91_9SPHI|nr:FecR family protein [Sphingobacterium hotanense]MDM1047650.1 FecR family protein [Sphingobacterium hotanense]
MEHSILKSIINILSRKAKKEDLSDIDSELLETFQKDEWQLKYGAQEDVKNRIQQAVHAKTIEKISRPSLKTTLLKIAAVIIATFFVGYLLMKQDNEKAFILSENHPSTVETPGLTTSDGTYKDLQTMKIGESFSNNKFTLVKSKAGVLRIESNDNSNEIIQINIKTAANENYIIELDDKSRVILDVNSELSFPSRFIENSRIVAAEGRAYFEVQTNPSKPFIVKSSKIEAIVTGTSFVFCSKRDEKTASISLVEGSLEIKGNNNSKKLKPGQKGHFSQDGIQILSFDEYETLAFTRNEFIFNDQPINEIMSVLSDWYNMEYSLKNINPEAFHFTLKIDRNKSIKEVLEIIEMTGDLQASIIGNKIIIGSKK